MPVNLRFSSTVALRIIGALGMLLSLVGCDNAAPPPATPKVEVAAPAAPAAPVVAPTPAMAPQVQGTVRLGYRVVATYPHDTGAFTQGLDWHEGQLYEGTGQEGASRVRRVDLATGKPLQEHALDAQYFGEGITILGNRIYQLTWQNKTGFVYDLATFKQLRTFSYRTEGWGLTNDGTNLIMSDGSAWLYYLDPETLEITRRIEVIDRGRSVRMLNELEWVNGEILANIWGKDDIAKIDPKTGKVIAWINLAGILPREDRTATTDVLNGIAFAETTGKLYVTGKYWPKLFEIELVEPQKP